MILSIPSERVARLTRPRATPELVAVAQRNVTLARTMPRTIRASAATESFGENLKKAVAKRKEQARQRQPKYRKVQRRKPTKGE